MLLFWRDGRFGSLAEIVDLLTQEVDEAPHLLEVLRSLYRSELVSIFDKYRYSVEFTSDHIYQALEVWGYLGSCHDRHPSVERSLIVTLRSTLPLDSGVGQVPYCLRSQYEGRVWTPALLNGAVGGPNPDAIDYVPCVDCNDPAKCLDGCCRAR